MMEWEAFMPKPDEAENILFLSEDFLDSSK